MAKETRKQQWLLSIVSCVAALGGLLFGYDTGVISGAILYIKQQFPITTFQEELIIGMVSLGALIGAISGGRLSDRFGRKKMVLFASVFFIISAIGLSLASSINELIVWRFLVGIAIGVSSATAPLYIAEISPRFMRGALVSINQLAITVGILLSYIIGMAFATTESWRMMFALAAIPAGCQLLIMSFFPESPRYLVKYGFLDEAIRILTKFRGSKKDAQLEIEHIQKLHSEKKAKWSEVFGKKMRPALIAGLSIIIIQQVTGINTIIYYAPTIFKFAGYTSDSAALYATMWVGIVNVAMTLVAIYLVDKLGRKPLLYSGLGGMVLSLLVLGWGFLYPQSEITGITSLITLLTYIASFAYSLGPIGWLLNSEIYPLHVRGRAMGVATCANWTSNFIITATFLNLVNRLGETGTFWLYGAIGILGILFIWRYVPETKAKSLEEIEEFWTH